MQFAHRAVLEVDLIEVENDSMPALRFALGTDMNCVTNFG